MTEVLKLISEVMDTLGLNYSYGEMTASPPAYPYWVGELGESLRSDGLEHSEASVILSGFSRGSFAELEAQKDLIRGQFRFGVEKTTSGGALLLAYFDGAVNIPTDDDRLKRCQIKIKIQIWEGS